MTRVLKRLGDPVRAGEALAIVESRDAAQIAADRTSAGAKATVAQKSLARERHLYDQKVSARVDLERAQAEAAAAAAEANRAHVAAGAANITRDGRGAPRLASSGELDPSSSRHASAEAVARHGCILRWRHSTAVAQPGEVVG